MPCANLRCDRAGAAYTGEANNIDAPVDDGIQVKLEPYDPKPAKRPKSAAIKENQEPAYNTAQLAEYVIPLLPLHPLHGIVFRCWWFATSGSLSEVGY
jgi:hypothetical protein